MFRDTFKSKPGVFRVFLCLAAQGFLNCIRSSSTEPFALRTMSLVLPSTSSCSWLQHPKSAASRDGAGGAAGRAGAAQHGDISGDLCRDLQGFAVVSGDQDLSCCGAASAGTPARPPAPLPAPTASAQGKQRRLLNSCGLQGCQDCKCQI